MHKIPLFILSACLAGGEGYLHLPHASVISLRTVALIDRHRHGSLFRVCASAGGNAAEGELSSDSDP